jgi:hypothetical protein
MISHDRSSFIAVLQAGRQVGLWCQCTVCLATESGYVEFVRLNLTYIVSIWILTYVIGIWRLNLQKLTHIPQISRVAVNNFLLQHSKDLVRDCQNDRGKRRQRERGE